MPLHITSKTPGELLSNKSAYFITVPIVLAFLLGWLGFSVLWALLVGLFVLETVHIVIARKVKAHKISSRDLNPEELLTAPEAETVDWLNELIRKVWRNYPQYIEKIVLEKAAPILKQNSPSDFTEIKLKSFDIGTRAPVFSNFKVHKLSDPRDFLFDLDFIWASNLSILLSTTVTAIPIDSKVSDLRFDGHIRIRARLLPNQFPFCSRVRIQLLSKPELEINVKPISAGVDVCIVPVLNNGIYSIVARVIHGMLVYPNFMEFNIKEMLAPELPPSDGDAIPEDDEIAKETAKKADDAGLLSSGVNAVGNLGRGVVDGVGSIGKGVIGGVGAVGSGVASGVGAVGSGVASGVGAVGSGVVSGVSTVGSGVASGVGAVGSGVVGGVSAVGSGISNVGKGVVGGVGSVFGMGGKKHEEAAAPEVHQETS